MTTLGLERDQRRTRSPIFGADVVSAASGLRVSDEVCCLDGLQKMEPYGAPWWQTLATGRKSDEPENGRNKRKPLPWVATGCARAWMVRVVSTRPPSLLKRGSPAKRCCKLSRATSVRPASPTRTTNRRKKPRICGGFAKPSDGLEPSTPSLPCAPKPLPLVATGCGLACLSDFRGCPVCHWLPPVAPAGLHKCSTLSVGIRDANGFRRRCRAACESWLMKATARMDQS
jgi:hypothetical protein